MAFDDDDGDGDDDDDDVWINLNITLPWTARSRSSQDLLQSERREQTRRELLNAPLPGSRSCLPAVSADSRPVLNPNIREKSWK